MMQCLACSSFHSASQQATALHNAALGFFLFLFISLVLKRQGSACRADGASQSRGHRLLVSRSTSVSDGPPFLDRGSRVKVVQRTASSSSPESYGKIDGCMDCGERLRSSEQPGLTEHDENDRNTPAR